MKTNTIRFLKNYRLFAAQARYQTCLIYIDELKKTTVTNKQKLMMLKIIYELVASTEDLSMWLVAISKRNDRDKRYRDIWERILNVFIKENGQDETTEILKSYKRIKTIKGLLKKMDMPTVETLVKETNITSKEMNDGLEALKKAITVSIQNRTSSKGLAVRAYNKIKHGMMVYLDPDNINNLWIRDFSCIKSKKGRRLIRKNREMDIGVNIERAEEIVKTVGSVSEAIRGLIGLVLVDLEYRIKTNKIRMQSKNKNMWLAELNSGDI